MIQGGVQVEMRKLVLGVGVDTLSRSEAVKVIEEWIETGSRQENIPFLAAARPPLVEGNGRSMKVVVTAYSEFFVRAGEDEEFKSALDKADLVLPDGVSVLAAVDYKHLNSKFQISNFKVRGLRRIYDETIGLILGVWVGLRVITGNIGQPVTGVWLVEELLRLAGEKKWRVFLLGGFGDTAEQLKLKIMRSHEQEAGQRKNAKDEESAKVKGGQVIIEADAGSQRVERSSDEENRRIVKKINEFVPDLLLVAYGPGKQEKWLDLHKSEIYASVGIGVGGTFDELSGRVKRAPSIMEKMGLKWLWRLMMEPRRFGRIWRAVVIFPFKVWREEVN